MIADAACAGAEEADRRFAEGRVRGPLDGIPLGIKDLSPTAGIRTTRGSLLHDHEVPTDDAPIVARLKQAGAVILGKTNTPEFGWKSPTDNRLFGPTRNPWNLERTAAGSSGGSAAAVACGMGPLATGGDGGGSIRQPASFCGVFGIKPTSDSFPPSRPRSSATSSPKAPQPDGAGRRDDARRHRRARSRDVYSVPSPDVDYVAACDGGIDGLRVAWTPDLGYAASIRSCARLREARRTVSSSWAPRSRRRRQAGPIPRNCSTPSSTR